MLQSPGQYFLRPMTKEYKFDPPSQTIEVKEGTTLELVIAGIRVAYRSVYHYKHTHPNT